MQSSQDARKQFRIAHLCYETVDGTNTANYVVAKTAMLECKCIHCRKVVATTQYNIYSAAGIVNLKSVKTIKVYDPSRRDLFPVNTSEYGVWKSQFMYNNIKSAPKRRTVVIEWTRSGKKGYIHTNLKNWKGIVRDDMV